MPWPTLTRAIPCGNESRNTTRCVLLANRQIFQAQVSASRTLFSELHTFRSAKDSLKNALGNRQGTLATAMMPSLRERLEVACAIGRARAGMRNGERMRLQKTAGTVCASIYARPWIEPAGHLTSATIVQFSPSERKRI
jgi:hypothetical protein